MLKRKGNPTTLSCRNLGKGSFLKQQQNKKPQKQTNQECNENTQDHEMQSDIEAESKQGRKEWQGNYKTQFHDHRSDSPSVLANLKAVGRYGKQAFSCADDHGSGNLGKHDKSISYT